MERRWRPLLLALLLACGAAHAQRLSFEATGTVPFTPGEGAYLDALDCLPPACLAPDPLAPVIRMKTQRQGARQPLLLLADHGGWLPSAPLELYARYVVDGNQSEPSTTDWRPIGTLPTPGVDQARQDPVSDVTVEYQLRLTGLEEAGSYRTTVGFEFDGVRVTHQIEVVLPSILLLRVAGEPLGLLASLDFDYSTDDAGYLAAVDGGEPLRFSAADFDRVEVFSNYRGGYTVTVSAEQQLAPPASSLTVDDLLLGEARLDGRSFVSSGPSGGFVTLARPEDYGVTVDGTETPGLYLFGVTYRAVPNP